MTFLWQTRWWKDINGNGVTLLCFLCHNLKVIICTASRFCQTSDAPCIFYKSQSLFEGKYLCNSPALSGVLREKHFNSVTGSKQDEEGCMRPSVTTASNRQHGPQNSEKLGDVTRAEPAGEPSMQMRRFLAALRPLKHPELTMAVT